MDQRERLRALAAEQDASMSETLDAAFEALRRHRFFAEMARADTELTGEKRRIYEAERDQWLNAELA